MKNIYKIRLTAALLIFAMAILGIFGLFYPVKIFDLQFLPVFQRVIIDFSIIGLVILLFLAGLTLVCGRIYCSLICPFGILQEIAGILKGKIKKNKFAPGKNFPLKYFVAAIVWGVLLGGSAAAIRFIEPYTLFGSAQFSGFAQSWSFLRRLCGKTGFFAQIFARWARFWGFWRKFPLTKSI